MSYRLSRPDIGVTLLSELWFFEKANDLLAFRLLLVELWVVGETIFLLPAVTKLILHVNRDDKQNVIRTKTNDDQPLILGGFEDGLVTNLGIFDILEVGLGRLQLLISQLNFSKV